MFAKQITLTKEIYQYVWAKKSYIFTNLINFLAILALAAQLTSLVSIISHYSDPAVIISSYSVDAGNSIEVAKRTSLVNDNDWRPYGPAYYRVTKLISYFNENLLHNTSELNSNQKHESTLNFYLILISILSLAGVSILLASTTTPNFFMSILGSVLITNLLLKNSHITNLVFINHPDLIFSFLTGLFGIFLMKYLDKKNLKNLIFLTLIAGVAFLTKLLFIFIFFPSLLIYLLFKKITKLEFINIILLAGMFYLIAGFPQSLAVAGIFLFLVDESKYSIPVNIESVTTWLITMKDLFIPLLFAILVLNILFISKNRKIGVQKKFDPIHFLAFIAPAGSLLMINKSSNPYYYSIPFVIFLLIYLCVYLRSFFSGLNIKKYNNSYGALLILAYFFISAPVVPSEFLDKSSKYLEGREDIREIVALTNTFEIESLKLYTPYFPIAGQDYSIYARPFDQKNIEYYIFKANTYDERYRPNSLKNRIRAKLVVGYLRWNNYVENKPLLSLLKINSRLIKKNTLLNETNPEYLLLSAKWYSRYLEDKPSSYDLGGESYDSWNYQHKIYIPFKGLNEVNSLVSLNNLKYKLIYCKNSNQIWQLVK
jgi:hypothetical protein